MLPSGQQWLIEPIQQSGYSITINDDGHCEGLCFGIDNMGMQAILAEDTATFDSRLNKIYSFSPNQIATKINSLRLNIKNKIPVDPIELEIPAFFDGIVLYQYGHQYPHLFEKNSEPLIQNLLLTAPVVLSQKLEEQGGISEICSFSGIYDQNELTTYFEELLNTINKTHMSKPLALVLRSFNHGITVGYDPINKVWQFIDANQLPTKYILDHREIAELTFNAFHASKFIAVSTTICSSKAYSDTTKKCINNWMSNQDWQKIHTAYTEKAPLTDNHHASWLYMATLINEIKTVKLLLNAQADPNSACINGQTPLFTATEACYIDIVKLLLDEKANPDTTRSDGTTVLRMAANYDYVDIVKLLLAAKADVNYTDGEDPTPLHLVALRGHTEIVKLLLNNQANPANPNITVDNGITPLFVAAQEGHAEIVRLLLQNNANVDLAFKSTADSLRNFAKKRNLVSAMEEFINIKKPTALEEKIAMTPEEIAQVMGHTEIVTLLKNHRNTVQQFPSSTIYSLFALNETSNILPPPQYASLTP